LERRNLILSIVKGSRVSSQDELKEKLSGAGVEVTQATLPAGRVTYVLQPAL